MSLSEFVVCCQRASGRNFTYDAPTGEALRATNVPLSGTQRIAEREFDGWFAAVLAGAGFEVHPVGPADLRVLAIRRRS